jgi:LysM repeat protein
MRRKTRLLSNALLAALTVVITACNLTTVPNLADTSATQTKISILFTQVSGTLSATAPPSPTLPPTLTATPTVLPIFLTPTPGFRPLYYTLQPGEFPFCIARRFDVNPKDLLILNNLPSGMIYMPGQVLAIPQSGRPFPPPRALRAHPTPYIVPESHMSVYKVACQFGDVDPLAIVQYNKLLSYVLDLGMTIQIP